MKIFRTSLLAGLVIAAVGGGYVYTRSAAKTTSAGAAAGDAAKAAQTVSVFTARVQDMPVTIEANGNVYAIESVDLQPQLSAVIKDIAIRNGQVVRKGDVLFRFDDRAERANLERVQAQLVRDRALLVDAERQLTRAQDLRAQGFFAQAAVDTAQSQVEAQRANLRLDEATIRSAEVALSLLTIRAPLSGRTGVVTVSEGSLVLPSGAPLVTISQMDPIGVNFNLPETQLAAVLAAGDSKARLQVIIPSGQRNPASASSSLNSAAPAASGAAMSPVAAIVRSADAPTTPAAASASATAVSGARGARADAVVEGTVSFVDNAVDSATGTIRLKGRLPNAKQALWPGQYVQVRLVLRTIKDAVVVPQAALIIRGSERSIYVVDADDKAQLRVVQPRFASGDLVVVEGVEGGERVVVDGKQNLRPGTAVKVAGKGASKGAAQDAAKPGAVDPAASAPVGKMLPAVYKPAATGG
ncbi:MAG: efflux RND transporter periplasmic adaptor subunit [Leptothrix sp. (in: b-proteobacteria)]